MEYRVKVELNQKKEGVVKLSDGRFKVSVHEDRKEGKANRRVRELIAEYFAVPLVCVRIIKGHEQSSKTLRIL